jgi:4-amino-4-deoxy-L-arabinose transferase-like glycosyltransferase
MDASASAAIIPKASLVTVIALSLLLAGAAFWGVDKRIVGLFHDDGIYTVVGKSIAEQHGYYIVSLPTSPAQTKYPFVYSYLLSWFWLLDPSFPQNIVLLKSLNILILVAIFFGSVVYYRRYTSGSGAAALLFAVLVCCNPIIFGFTDYVLSDLLLVLITLTALIICAGAESRNAGRSRALPLAIVAGLACLTRLAALPIVIAGGAHALVRRGWRASAGFFLSAVLLLTPWLAWLWYNRQRPTNSLFAYYTGYEAPGTFSAAVATAGQWSIVQGNAYYLADMFSKLFLTPLFPGVGIVFALFTTIGAIKHVRRDNVFACSLLVSWVVLLLVWPFHPGRYLAPLVPLLLMFLFCGIARVTSWIKGTLKQSWSAVWLSRLMWSPVLILLLLEGVWLSGYLLIRDEQTTRGLYGNRLPYSWSGFEESFAWIRAHTRPDAVLATAYDPMYYLYTQRRAIRPALHRPRTYFYPQANPQPDVGRVEEVKPQLVKLGISHLVVDPLDGYAEGKATAKLMDELIQSFGSSAEKVFTSSDGKHRIYRLALK